MIEAPEHLRLAISALVPGGPEPPDDGWNLTDDMIAAAHWHRVHGLLWAAIANGVVRGDERSIDDAHRGHLRWLHASLAAEETAVLALDALAAEGVRVRVLKGVAVAHLDYDDPRERVFGDADLLVHREDHRRALSALASAGFVRAEPAVRGWWERRFGKAVVLHTPSGGELDLHLRIAGGFFGERIDHDDLWSRRGDVFVLAGRPAEALDAEGRLLHACCHAVLGGGSGLRALVDVAQLVMTGVDWTTTAQRAGRDGVDLVLAAALHITWTQLALDPAHPAATWALAHAADPLQAAAMDEYRAAFAGERWLAEGHSTLPALGRVDRARFLGGLALPSTASLRARDRTWREHLLRGMTQLRRAR